MRSAIVKAVSIALFAAPIAGPAAFVELTHSGVANAATSACPTGMTRHAGGSYTETSSDITPIRYKGSNDCYDGTSVKSNISTSNNWWQMKQCCNGAAITVDSGPTALVNSYTYNAGVDGIRTWNGAAVTMIGVHEVYTRDDCISDISHGDLIIRDSLFDGCHTGISWRSTNSSNTKPFKIDIQDTMFYVQPEPGSTSGGNCTQYVVNGMANGPMWKMDKVQSGVNLKNVIIRQDLGNHECKDSWPSGTYSNVTFVWTGSGNYPGTLPAGVTMTRDVSVWNNAKNQWLSAHSASGGSNGTPSPAPSQTTSPSPSPSPSTSPSPAPSPTTSPTTPPSSGAINKVLLIVEENHNAAEAKAGMPYLSSQAAAYGEATNYNALADKSLPNYLALTGGSMFGVSTDIEPGTQAIHGDSLFSQVRAAGKTAKAYFQSMPSNCDWSKNDDPYSNHHNPWAYFSDDQPACQKYDVGMGSRTSGALQADITKGLPNFSLVVPDKMHDAHDGTLGAADNWLKNWLPQIEAGPDYKAGHLAIVVTFDEGSDTSTSRQVLTVVISPNTSKVVSNTAYDHYSLLRTMSEILGVTPLRSAASATSMRSAFHI